MEEKDIKKGQSLRVRDSGEVVVVVSVGKVTKHYGPKRNILVRYPDGAREYIAPEGLEKNNG